MIEWAVIGNTVQIWLLNIGIFLIILQGCSSFLKSLILQIAKVYSIDEFVIVKGAEFRSQSKTPADYNKLLNQFMPLKYIHYNYYLDDERKKAVSKKRLIWLSLLIDKFKLIDLSKFK